MDRPQPPVIRPNALLLVALSGFAPMSIDLCLASLPAMRRVFATDVSRVQLTLSVFVAGFAFAQLVCGPLSDRFGRRPVLLGGLILYVLASLFCLGAPDIDALLLGRFLQALGGCSGPVLARAIVRDVYPRDEAARMLAAMASAMAVGAALAPFIGGNLQAWFGWRANFLVLVIFGSVVLVAAWCFLAETNLKPNRNALEPSGMLETYRQLLSDRLFLGYTLTVSLSFAGLFAFISGASFVLIDVLGVRPQQFGFSFVGAALGYMCGSFAASRLTARVGLDIMLGVGVLIGMLGGLALSGLAIAGLQSIPAVMVPVAAVFFSAGLVLPNGTAGAMAPHPHWAGSASALLGFIQMATGAGVGWLVGRLHDGTTLPMAVVIGGAECLAILAYWRLVSHRAS